MKFSIGLIIAVILLIAGLHIYWAFPIHQVSVDCHDFDVYFEGPKNQKFMDVFAEHIRKRNAPVIIKDERIFSTDNGVAIDQIDKVIMYKVRPEWFRALPNFEDPETERIFMAWVNSGKSRNVNDKWCHVLEAAISKNGIDIEARRKNPRIWPRDKFPIPEE